MPQLSDAAKEIFLNHFNCAQAVFAALAPAYGLPEETALKLASPFGGGVARRGEVCGAVTGALLALGLAQGSSTPEGKEETYRLAQEFLRRFEQKYPSLLCRNLIGCDLSTPEGYQQATEKGIFRSICLLLVGDAAEIVQALLV